MIPAVGPSCSPCIVAEPSILIRNLLSERCTRLEFDPPSQSADAAAIVPGLVSPKHYTMVHDATRHGVLRKVSLVNSPDASNSRSQSAEAEARNRLSSSSYSISAQTTTAMPAISTPPPASAKTKRSGASASSNPDSDINVLSMLETHALLLDFASWLLDGGGVEHTIESVSAQLCNYGMRNRLVRTPGSALGAESTGNDSPADGAHDWIPTYHASVGRFLLRLFLAKQAEVRREAESATLDPRRSKATGQPTKSSDHATRRHSQGRVSSSLGRRRSAGSGASLSLPLSGE